MPDALAIETWDGHDSPSGPACLQRVAKTAISLGPISLGPVVTRHPQVVGNLGVLISDVWPSHCRPPHRPVIDRNWRTRPVVQEGQIVAAGESRSAAHIDEANGPQSVDSPLGADLAQGRVPHDLGERHVAEPLPVRPVAEVHVDGDLAGLEPMLGDKDVPERFGHREGGEVRPLGHRVTSRALSPSRCPR